LFCFGIRLAIYPRLSSNLSSYCGLLNDEIACMNHQLRYQIFFLISTFLESNTQFFEGKIKINLSPNVMKVKKGSEFPLTLVKLLAEVKELERCPKL
jgi:hypothetical protein